MEWMNIDKDINPLQESDYQLTEDIFPHENQSIAIHGEYEVGVCAEGF